MVDEIFPTKESIYKLYISKNMTRKQIAKSKHISVTTVQRALEKYSIKKTKQDKISKEVLYDLYIANNLKASYIARKFKVTEQTIYNYVKDYGLSKRK